MLGERVRWIVLLWVTIAVLFSSEFVCFEVVQDIVICLRRWRFAMVLRIPGDLKTMCFLLSDILQGYLPRCPYIYVVHWNTREELKEGGWGVYATSFILSSLWWSRVFISIHPACWCFGFVYFTSFKLHTTVSHDDRVNLWGPCASKSQLGFILVCLTVAAYLMEKGGGNLPGPVRWPVHYYARVKQRTHVLQQTDHILFGYFSKCYMIVVPQTRKPVIERYHVVREMNWREIRSIEDPHIQNPIEIKYFPAKKAD